MELDINSRLDRYMNRELHPAAARALAHEALDDPQLFEELTAISLARAAVDSPATTDRALAQAALDDEDLFDTLVARGAVEAAVRTPLPRRRRAIVITGMATAAAASLLAFFVLRPSPLVVRQPAQPAHAVVSQPFVAPAILLTSELQPVRSHAAPIFRGADAASRAPKTEGAIISLEDRIATVNLGSVDGLAKGTELPVIRNGSIGRIVITTVFRDRARGDIVDGETIQTGDQVRVPGSVHFSSILQQVNAAASSGDLKTARDLARKSLVGGAPGETRQLLERLAALDYQAGAVDAAREHYELAVNRLDQPPMAGSTERVMTLASYGALSLERRDRERADDLLRKALAQAVDPALRSEIFNNLGALAELRGDAVKAVSFYNQALEQQPSQPDRAIVQANLARINSKHP
jgi:tetratricopeptide (TPR) repeat protein